jgi:hypothetical protein
MKNIEKLVDKSLELTNIEFSKNADISGIKTAIKNHYEIMIHNITAIAIVVALASNVKKLQPSHIETVKSYIQTKCTHKGKHYGMRGGTALPSEYCGYPMDPSPYSAGNGAEESTSTVDFAGGIIRPAINISGGGSAKELVHFVCTNKDVKAEIRDKLKKSNLTISPPAMNVLIHIIEIHIHCALNDLKTRGPLSISKVNTVMKMKSHAIFH